MPRALFEAGSVAAERVLLTVQQSGIVLSLEDILFTEFIQP